MVSAFCCKIQSRTLPGRSGSEGSPLSFEEGGLLFHMGFLAIYLTALALAAALTAGILAVVCRLIRRTGCGLSEYYFHVSQRPQEPGLLDRVMSSFTGGLLLLAGFLALFLLAFAAAYRWLRFQPERLADVVDLLQSNVNILPSILVAVTLLFATFKKPTYVLFSSRDVVQRYHLLPYMLIATSSWVLAIICQVAALLAPQEPAQFWPVLLYSCALALLAASCVCSLLFLLISHRILYSSETAELKLLLKLRYRLYEPDSALQLADCGDTRTVHLLNRYLLKHLVRRSGQLAKQLRRTGPCTRVEFWDTAAAPPLSSGARTVLQVCILPVALSIPLAALFWLPSGSDSVLVRLRFFTDHSLVICLLALCVSGACLLLLFRYPPFRQLARVQMLGGWGYRLCGEDGHPRLYFSRTQWPGSCGSRWLAALCNILTLYRIELLSGFADALPQALEDLWSHCRDREEVLLLKLAHCLCRCYQLERTGEGADSRALIEEMRRAAGDLWTDPLFFTWAAALWADVRRDPAWFEKHTRTRKAA